MVLLTNPLLSFSWMTGSYGYRYRGGWDFFANLIPWVGPAESIFWSMVMIQMVVGLAFLALAIAGLRPLRGSSWPGAEPRTGWWTRLRTRAQALGRHRAAAAMGATSCWRSAPGGPPAAMTPCCGRSDMPRSAAA